MNYFYILFPFIVWIISQTIKFWVRVYKQNVPNNIKGAFWVYVWAGGTPSTHTAILTSSLVLVIFNYGLSPVSTFAVTVTMLVLYDMVVDRKREEMLEQYYMKDTSLVSEVKDGYILDLAGHTIREVLWGAVLGISIGILAIQLGF